MTNTFSKNYKIFGIGLGVLLIIVAFSSITIQQTAFGNNKVKITQFGYIESQSFTQEIFSSDKLGSCKLDDQRLSACAATQGYDSRLGELTYHYWEDGWSALKSCRGFMNYYGCFNTLNSGNCEIVNSGTCPGAATDGNDVECAIDDDCNSAPDQYCYNGKCITSTKSECSGGNYKCNSGAIYRCGIDDQWHWYGECTYLVARSNYCVNDNAQSGDAYLLCKVDEQASEFEKIIDATRKQDWTPGDLLCANDNECNELATCNNGLCVPKVVLPNGQLVSPDLTRGQGETPNEGDSCTKDFEFQCKDTNQKIITAQCVDNKYTLTGVKCDAPGLSTLWDVYSGWIIAGLVGLALILAMLITK